MANNSRTIEYNIDRIISITLSSASKVISINHLSALIHWSGLNQVFRRIIKSICIFLIHRNILNFLLRIEVISSDLNFVFKFNYMCIYI